MTTVNIYLTFKGNCEEAFNFYKTVFGGEFPYVGRYKDIPQNEGPAMPEEVANKIMHISLPISKETAIMGADSVEGFGPEPVIGTNFSISVNCDSITKAEQIFNGLAAGGIVTMPAGKTFWAEYFGMLIDKFGINWMVNVDLPQMSN